MIIKGIVKVAVVAAVVVGCAKSNQSQEPVALQGNGVTSTDTQIINGDCLTNPNAANDPNCNTSTTSTNPQFCFTQQNCVCDQQSINYNSCIQNSAFSPILTNSIGQPFGTTNNFQDLCSCPPGQELVFNADGLAACRRVVSVENHGFYMEYSMRPRRSQRYSGSSKNRHSFDFVANFGTQNQAQDIDAGACNNSAKMICEPGRVIDECSAVYGNGAIRCVPVAGTNYGFCGIPQ